MPCFWIGLLVYLSIPHDMERAMVMGGLPCDPVHIDEACGKGIQMLLPWFLQVRGPRMAYEGPRKVRKIRMGAGRPPGLLQLSSTDAAMAHRNELSVALANDIERNPRM